MPMNAKRCSMRAALLNYSTTLIGLTACSTSPGQ